MIYLLTLLVSGFATWPYYHRFKTFGKDWNPLPLAMLHATPIGFGVVAILAYANEVGNLNHIFAFDLIAGVTFWLMVIGLTVWNAYLIFTSETFQAPDDFGLAIFAFCGVCILALFMSTPAAYIITIAVGSIQ